MNNNILYLVIEITQLLSKHNCTYKDADIIIKMLENEIKQQRNDLDLEIITETNMYRYLNKHLSDDKIVKPLNHIDSFY